MSKPWRAYVAAVEAFCTVAMAAVLLIGTMQVVWRYAFHSSLFWSEEVLRYLIIWLVMIAAGLSFTRGQFLGMRMAVERLPERGRKLANLLSALIMLLFLGVVVFYGGKFAWMTRLQSATATGLSMLWIHGAIVVGGLLLALHVALNEIFGIAREERRAEHDIEESKL